VRENDDAISTFYVYKVSDKLLINTRFETAYLKVFIMGTDRLKTYSQDRLKFFSHNRCEYLHLQPSLYRRVACDYILVI